MSEVEGISGGQENKNKEELRARNVSEELFKC